MSKTYRIALEGQTIGNSQLERADAPMGVVMGWIDFNEMADPYHFFRAYCLKNKIPLNLDDAQWGAIDTQVIPNLQVFRPDGLLIKGCAGNTISGMREEGFEVTILGIDYPFFEAEFPHHVKTYQERFKK